LAASIRVIGQGASVQGRRNGVDPRVIDSILGWAPLTVQDKYHVAVVSADLHRAILKL
jgi:hypothetical protein